MLQHFPVAVSIHTALATI